MAAGDLTDFKARLGLDTAPVEQGFKKVEAKAGALDKVFSKVGESFANKFIGVFAAGAITRGVSNLVGSVAGIATEATKLAAQYKLTLVEAQLLMQLSDRTGKSVADMVKNSGELADNLKAASAAGFATLNESSIKALTKASEAVSGVKSGILASLGAVGAELLKNPKNALAALFGGLGGGGAGIGEIITRRLTPGKGDSQAVAQLQANEEQEAFAVTAEARLKDHNEKVKQSVEDNIKFEDAKSMEAADLRDDEEKLRIKKIGEDARRMELKDEIGLLKSYENQDDPELRRRLVDRELELEGIGAPKISALKGDSLISVGNFLGSDPTAGSRGTQATLTEMARSLKNIEMATKAGSLRGQPTPYMQ